MSHKIRGISVETSFPCGVLMDVPQYDGPVLCLGHKDELLAYEVPDFFPSFVQAGKCQIILKIDL